MAKNKRVNKRHYKARWLLPLLLLVGYLATYSRLEGFEIQYLGLSFLGIIACCLLLTRLGPPLHKKLPIWIILIVFIVAYYLKFYLLVSNPEILGEGWVQRKLYLLLQSPPVLFETFETISYAFIVFCITAWFLLSSARSLRMKILKKEINYRSVIPILIWLIPILMGITTYVMYITGICRMAADTPYLPFHLAGWIFYIRTTLIPALLLLLIWCSDKVGMKKHFSFGIILLFLHGFIGTFLRASRGALLLLFILLIMLFLVTNRLTKKRMWLFGTILFIAIIMFPIITSFRYIRAADLSVVPSLGEAIRNILDIDSSYFSMMKEGVVSIIFRLTGVENLLHVIGAGFQPLYTNAITGSMSVPRFFTIYVLGFSPSDINLDSPSLIGWFYLVGGSYLVVIGIFCFVILVWIVWRALLRSKLRCLPIAQALLLLLVLKFSSGGLPSRLGLIILVNVGSIAACEWLLRTFRQRSSFR